MLESSSGLSIEPDGDTFVINVSHGLDAVSIRVPHYEILASTADGEGSVLRFDRPTKSKEHPTMKPIPLVAQAIRNSSQPDDVVLDMFLGAGSTLIAAEQTGRTCVGLEIDPIYCDVIVRRWETLTGQRAVKS